MPNRNVIAVADQNDQDIKVPSFPNAAGFAYRQDAGLLITIDPVTGLVAGPGQISLRKYFTVAQVNAGATVLPAVPGMRYRLTSMRLFATGADATVATAVILTGTQAGATVTLFSVLIAALVRSAVVGSNSANATPLADGAWTDNNDVNTPILIGKTGGTLAGSTLIGVLLDYNLVSA